MQQVTIQGSAGTIEGMLDLSGDASRCAVLCHPHPLYGGTMFDAVVTTMAKSISASHVGTLQFNFRGVGESQGTHDKGVGEIDDVVSVVEWLQHEKNIASVLLGGYSFGAIMALNALPRLTVEKAVLVAPPVSMMSACVPTQIPMLVILGEQDNVVDSQSTAAFFKHAEVCTIATADHSFAGAGDKVATAISEFI